MVRQRLQAAAEAPAQPDRVRGDRVRGDRACSSGVIRTLAPDPGRPSPSLPAKQITGNGRRSRHHHSFRDPDGTDLVAEWQAAAARLFAGLGQSGRAG
ncbi:hypothetical protein EDD35_1084 [Amycolatopsis thermoflava]|uniref:Uncharacterized protein n=1 Tax=Amycolatopsis thermoflava TaxID=84480 RepID=A0A3N2GQ99_9PSEU|nr:hypothetical protein EDD35_1084 [Amycolatopsis thermoflava]